MIAYFVHECRNPLASIMGFTQFLEQHPKIKADYTLTKYVSLMKEESLQIDSLIQELLCLSPTHIEKDAFSIIDVKFSLEKVVSVYELQAKKSNITINTNIVEDLFVTGKANQFERMIINLLKNAIEAIHENGTIDLVATKSNRHILISIIDSGPGLSFENIKHAFNPFFTTKKEGTGIGLTISKATIEALNGSIHIEKHPDKGLHVKISLPEYEHKNKEKYLIKK